MKAPPDELDVFGMMYSIIRNDEKMAEENKYAECDFDELRIWYSHNCAPSQAKLSSVHEAVHAYLAALGIDTYDEHLVQNLALMIFYMARHNKEWMTWVME